MITDIILTAIEVIVELFEDTRGCMTILIK